MSAPAQVLGVVLGDGSPVIPTARLADEGTQPGVPGELLGAGEPADVADLGGDRVPEHPGDPGGGHEQGDIGGRHRMPGARARSGRSRRRARRRTAGSWPGSWTRAPGSLAVVLSSPDVAPVTIQTWAGQDPIDPVTATSELAGTSFSAAYGPPCTDDADSVQAIGPFAPQSWAGNAVHLDAAQDFVLGPLGAAAVGTPISPRHLARTRRQTMRPDRAGCRGTRMRLARPRRRMAMSWSRQEATDPCPCSWPRSWSASCGTTPAT